MAFDAERDAQSEHVDPSGEMAETHREGQQEEETETAASEALGGGGDGADVGLPPADMDVRREVRLCWPRDWL